MTHIKAGGHQIADNLPDVDSAKENAMLTTTEVILNLCIWALLGVGLFFSLRAALRRRRQRRDETSKR